MATAKQKLGSYGERLVCKHSSCPKCKRDNTLKTLPQNFKCADIICDFCGFLAQVKSKNVKNIHKMPKTLLGAAWGPQKKRMDSAIYFPLFVVLVHDNVFSIYYLSSDLQQPELFIARKPLSATAKRAGWQGFYYDLTKIPPGAMVHVFSNTEVTQPL